MLKSARAERKTLTEIAEQELRRAEVIEYGIACLLLVTAPDYVAEKLRLALNAFDFIVWRRGSTRLQGSPGEAVP